MNDQDAYVSFDLIRAWENWDARPRNEDIALKYEHACAAFAPGQTTRLRDHLASGLRAGMTRHAALATWNSRA